MTNVIALSRATAGKAGAPLLTTMHLADPIPREHGNIATVELRDPVAGRAAHEAAANRGADVLDQTIAALIAMSDLDLDDVEDMDLSDLGRVLSTVTALLIQTESD